MNKTAINSQKEDWKKTDRKILTSAMPLAKSSRRVEQGAKSLSFVAKFKW